MAIMAQIREQLKHGKSTRELIGMGYKASSVYKAKRQLRGTQSGDAVGSGRGRQGDPAARQFSVDDAALPQIEADPEILELKKAVRVARLERELTELKGTASREVGGIVTVQVSPETVRHFQDFMATARANGHVYAPSLEDWIGDVVSFIAEDHSQVFTPNRR